MVCRGELDHYCHYRALMSGSLFCLYHHGFTQFVIWWKNLCLQETMLQDNFSYFVCPYCNFTTVHMAPIKFSCMNSRQTLGPHCIQILQEVKCRKQQPFTIKRSPLKWVNNSNCCVSEVAVKSIVKPWWKRGHRVQISCCITGQGRSPDQIRNNALLTERVLTARITQGLKQLCVAFFQKLPCISSRRSRAEND